MHDSGDRDTFSSGCVRDNGETKPRPDLISPFAKIRLGEWLRKGAEKYDERNWEKGMPISRCLEAIDRHYCKYQMNMTDEDHMAAIMCNAMFIMHYEEMIKIGNLPATIDNRPSYHPMPIPVRFPAIAACTIRQDDALVYTTPKLDGARLPFVKKIEGIIDKFGTQDDKMANLKRRLADAQDALRKELDDVIDKSYGLELADQNANPVGLNPILADHYPTDKFTGKPPMSKVTGKAIALNKVRKFILPDDNQCPPPKMPNTCDICGSLNVKYYRQDLKRFYCSGCYYLNNIDKKPVINWS